jgi:soluble lytic murein transglycosylase-like protein
LLASRDVWAILKKNTMRFLPRQLLPVLLLASSTVLAADTPSVDPALRAQLIQAVEDTRSFSDRYDAEVWLTDMSQRLANRVPDARARMELLRHVHQEATRAQLPPELVLSVIEVESNFNRFAISSAGARGLMQVMPFWLKEIGRPGDSLFRVETNLRYGCTILKYYIDKEDGNLYQALARYNGSRGNRKYPGKVNSIWRTRWHPQ